MKEKESAWNNVGPRAGEVMSEYLPKNQSLWLLFDLQWAQGRGAAGEEIHRLTRERDEALKENARLRDYVADLEGEDWLVEEIAYAVEENARLTKALEVVRSEESCVEEILNERAILTRERDEARADLDKVLADAIYQREEKEKAEAEVARLRRAGDV